MPQVEEPSIDGSNAATETEALYAWVIKNKPELKGWVHLHVTVSGDRESGMGAWQNTTVELHHCGHCIKGRSVETFRAMVLEYSPESARQRQIDELEKQLAELRQYETGHQQG